MAAFLLRPAPEAVQEEPAKEVPAKEEPAKETPAKEEPAKEVPSKEPAKETVKPKEEPAKEVPAKDDLPANPHFDVKPFADKPDGDQSAKAIKSWAEARAENKRLATALAEKEAALKTVSEETLKTVSGESAQLKADLEKRNLELVELQRELKAANFERTPEYIAKVKKPLGDIQQAVKDIAASNEASGEKLWEAITEPDAKKRAALLDDITEGFRRSEQFELINMAKSYQDINAFKERFAGEAESILESERARQAAKDQEFIENDRNLQRVFAQKTWTGLEDRHEFLREVDGQKDWNESLNAAKRAIVETNLDKLDVETRTSILTKAAVVPFLESAIRHFKGQLASVTESKDAKIAEMQAQLDGLVKATPGIGGGTKADLEEKIATDHRGLSNTGARILGRV